MKLKKAMTFKPIKGMWKNVSGDSEVLATTLERCLQRYENKNTIWNIE